MHPTWPSLFTQARPRGRVVAPPTPCCGPQPAVSRRVVAWPLGCVAGQVVVSWPSAARRHGSVVVMSRHSSLTSCSPGHNTLQCIAIQKPSSQPLLVTIHFGVLQYNCPAASPSLSITIQWCIVILTQPFKPTMSQYNGCIVTHSPATQAAAYCNTIVAHKAMSQYNFIGQ